MNRWALMLADVPPTLQRLIARRQRISLPRRCSSQERHSRLRAALCHARSVRAIYFGLPPDQQAALQELRACPRGLSLEQLTTRFGPLRPLSHIAADITPHSLSEQLLLLGFLLPRPPTPRHPTRFLLPPELRNWLPHPLSLPDYGPAPDPTVPLALDAARVILLAVAEAPLPLRADAMPRKQSLRHLAARLALPEPEAAALCRFVWPLLTDQGMLAPHGDAAALAPAGSRFLARTPRDQLALLRAAWVRAPHPDRWLRDLGVGERGIDWPLLRRRLLAWAAALPSGRLFDPAALHAALADALGPLSDAQTHGFRCYPPDRAPWQNKVAALVWDAAMRGPLSWLGALAWTTENREPRTENQEPRTENQEQRTKPALSGGEGNREQAGHPFTRSPVHPLTRSPAHPLTRSRGWVFRPLCDADDLPPLDEGAQPWQYGALGEVRVPRAMLDRRVLALLPFARFSGADAGHLTYRITRRSLADAARTGRHVSALHNLLTQHAGAVPTDWDALLSQTVPAVRIIHAAVVTSDDPAVLARAATARSVRRYLGAHLAPGIALVEGKRANGLLRALKRQELAVAVRGDPQLAPPAELTPAECATLLASIAHYRELVNAETLPPSVGALEDRLRAALPATIAAAEAGSVRPRILATRRAVPRRSARPVAWPAPIVPPQTDPALPVTAQADTPAPPSPQVAALRLRQPIRLVGWLAALGCAVWALLLMLLSRHRVSRGKGADRAPSCDGVALGKCTPEDGLVTQGQNVDTEGPAHEAAAHSTSYLAPLREAISHQRLVRIRYRPVGKPSGERTIRPLVLENHADRWYVQAYCTQAQAERMFRLDRIDDLTPLKERLRGRAPRRRAQPVARPGPRPAARRGAALDTGFFPPPPPAPPAARWCGSGWSMTLIPLRLNSSAVL